MSRLGNYLSLVKFSHSIFALPFALQGAWMAQGGVPDWRSCCLVVLAAVAARTAAMGFNRLVDARLDRDNPRTSERELPAGVITRAGAIALVVIASALFILIAFLLNPLCGWLSFPVLAVLLGYSVVKRFSFAAHIALGLALGIAPLGAWLAIRGDLAGPLAPVLWLSVGVLTWVAGFDLIYACQDAEHDRKVGLHSIPARFGIARALGLSKLLHLIALACFVFQGLAFGLGWIYAIGVVVAAALIIWEHSIVSPKDLSRVNAAFFTANGWVGLGLFLALALDLGFSGGRH